MNTNKALHLVRTGEVNLAYFDDLVVRFGDLNPRLKAMTNTKSARYAWARTFLENVALFSVKWSKRLRTDFTEYVELLETLGELENEEFFERMGTPEYGEPESDKVRSAREKARRAGFEWLDEVRDALDRPWYDPDFVE